MKKKVWIECKKCGGREFRIERNVEYEGSWHSAVMHECLAHDGFGWELEDFDLICTKCGSVNDIVVRWEGDKEGEE